MLCVHACVCACVCVCVMSVFLWYAGRKKKLKNWEEDDFYSSDEDTFLDRTGISMYIMYMHICMHTCAQHILCTQYLECAIKISYRESNYCNISFH